MKIIKFSGLDEMAYDMLHNKESGKDVLAVMFYEDACTLLKELMVFMNVRPGLIEIEDSMYDGYDREYYISLIDEPEKEDFVIFAEKAYKSGLGPNKNKTGYLFSESDIAYLNGDIHSSIIPHIEARRIFEVEITGEAEHKHENEVKKKSPFVEDAKAKKPAICNEHKDIKNEDAIDVDISVDVNVTTVNNGKVEHLDDLEKDLLELIDEVIETVFSYEVYD